jgi:hypothetical protein
MRWAWQLQALCGRKPASSGSSWVGAWKDSLRGVSQRPRQDGVGLQGTRQWGLSSGNWLAYPHQRISGSAGEGAPTEEPRPNVQRPKGATRDHAKPFGRARVRASRVCSCLPRVSSFAGACKLNRYGVDTLPPYMGSVIVPWVCLYTGPKAGFGSSDE